jgi:dTDP-4-dehydrorhamnose 3,5-epimerase
MHLASRSLHFDSRGYFGEIYRAKDYGGEVPVFIQDNLSFSNKGVLRGMHFQVNQWQILTVLKGSIFDVTFDVNPSSPTFRQKNMTSMEYNANNQLLIPPGVAHGFCVISDEAVLHYKSSVYYGETLQFGVSWNSVELDGLWPNCDWTVSERDSSFPTISDFLSTNYSV